MPEVRVRVVRMDAFTKEQRSEIMSRIRGKWTKPEVFAHNVLKGHKIRHEMHPNAPGNPDILIKGDGIAIFIDGCFWHGCPDHYREPKTNRKYWVPKIARNVQRDRNSRRKAWRNGLRTRRIRECRLSSARLLAAAEAH